MTIEKKNESASDFQKILLIGGGGFLGRHISALAMSQGHSVTIADRYPRPPSFRCDAWHETDIASNSEVRSLIKGHQSAIYLASASLPATSNEHISDEVSNHVAQAVRTAEICLQAGLRFVFASSGGTVYGKTGKKAALETDLTIPITAYGASKLAIENYIRILGHQYGRSVVSLRISNPYGIWQKADRKHGFIAAAIQARKEGVPLRIWGDGEIIRDFVHADDVARCFLNACRYNAAPVTANVGSGVGYSLNFVIGLLNLMMQEPVVVEYEPPRSTDVPVSILDITVARQNFSWEPAIALKDGLRQLLEEHGLFALAS